MVGQTAQDGALTATVTYLPSQLLAGVQYRDTEWHRRQFCVLIVAVHKRRASQEAVWKDVTHWSVGLRIWRMYWLGCGLGMSIDGIPRRQPRSFRDANLFASLLCRLCMWIKTSFSHEHFRQTVGAPAFQAGEI